MFLLVSRVFTLYAVYFLLFPRVSGRLSLLLIGNYSLFLIDVYRYRSAWFLVVSHVFSFCFTVVSSSFPLLNPTRPSTLLRGAGVRLTNGCNGTHLQNASGDWHA